jgi:hypothetical protein
MDTVDVFDQFTVTIVCSDYDRFNASVNQRFRQVIGANCPSLLWSIKMMMKDDDFHPAKKGKRLIAKTTNRFFSAKKTNKARKAMRAFSRILLNS